MLLRGQVQDNETVNIIRADNGLEIVPNHEVTTEDEDEEMEDDEMEDDFE